EVVEHYIAGLPRTHRDHARLVQRLAPRFKVDARLALAIVRDVDLSRDVAQDVFLAAWRDLKDLRDPESFLPWLRQLTRHRAYHVLRTERRRDRRVTFVDDEELRAIDKDTSPTVEASLLAEEERRVLEAVLSELADDVREVVTLYYREGESTAHVARLLGLSEAAVRQRLSRARKQLRATLLDRFGAAAMRTTPGAAFTAAVVGALTAGAPAAASATTITIAASAPSLAAKLAAVAGGIALGASGGIAGIILGTRPLKRQARTARELDGLRRFERAGIALVVATTVMFPVGFLITGSRWAPVATFAAFLVGLAWLQHGWLPRIVRERHEAEAREDPARAARARARERRTAVIGWTAGIVSGSLGLLAGLGLIRW
ncbi:MAG: RNA polymerase sigma factor, partial [Vicinamibacteria bacterium]